MRDFFTAPDNTGLEIHDPNWMGVTDYPVSGFEIVSNAVQSNFAWGNYAAYYNASTSDLSQIVFKAAADGAIGRWVAVRMGPDTRGYSAGFLEVSEGNFTRCYVRKNNNYLAEPFYGSWSSTSDHTVKIKVSGTTTVTLEVWIDGVSLGTKSDSSSPIISGHPGFYSLGTGTIAHSVMDDWTDEQKQVYYSVSPYGTGDIKTGSPTITISDGVATLSVAQTGNIGQGCRITYGGSSVCYISRVNSPTSYNVITATGGVPGDVSGQAVNSIAHEYASLYTAGVGFTDSDHINNPSLVDADVVVNFACYYDHDDYTPFSSQHLVCSTDTTRYVRWYAPNGGNQSIYNQRSSTGKWDSNKVCLVNNEESSSWFSSTAVVKLEGLQIRQLNDAFTGGVIVFGSSSLASSVEGCIIDRHVSAADGPGIMSAEDSTIVLSNTIIYGVSLTHAITDNWNNINLSVYNSIIAGGITSGIMHGGGGAFTVINSAVFNTADDFVGTMTVTHTASDDNDIPGTGNIGLNENANGEWDAAFSDYANGDFTPKSGSPLISAGIGPALDANVPLFDIAGNPRSGNTCSIGAFEYITEEGEILDFNSEWRLFTTDNWPLAWKIRAQKDAASAWRVFGFSDRQAAWRIKTQQDTSAVWKILVSLDHELAWKILSSIIATDIPLAWKVFAQKDQESIWKLFNSEDTTTAWRIKAQYDQPSSWKLFSTLDGDSSWKIFTSIDANLAWAILRGLVVDIVCSWKIHTAKDYDLLWRIKTDFDQSNAWKILRAMDDHTAWKILTSMDSDLAWAILRGVIVDIACSWKIQNVKDHDLLWKIKSAISREVGWKVFGTLDQEFTWRLFISTLEPFRKFIIERPKIWAFNLDKKKIVGAFDLDEKWRQ